MWAVSTSNKKANSRKEIINQIYVYSQSSQPHTAEAKKILNKFNCLDIAPILKSSEKALTRRALILITSLSDYQILGICADTAEEGILAMKTYSHAFGYEAPSNLPTI